MHILIIKNIPRESGGLIEDLLTEQKHTFDIIELDHQPHYVLPKNKYNAVFVLGGPDSANDQTTKMLNELTIVKTILKENIPYFGVCLGLQVLVKAAGGSVIKNPVKEIGLRHTNNELYTITRTAEKDSLLHGLPEQFTVFQLHGETVTPTNTMTTLGTGIFCKEQIVKCGPKQYGVQFHLEVTPELFACWLDEDDDLKLGDHAVLRKDFYEQQPEMQRNCIRILNNFLTLC